MSFFIKGKRTNNLTKNRYTQRINHKKIKENKPTKEDEIISSDDEGNKIELSGDKLSSEDEYETPQEKKLRLAKVYLEEIEKEETQRLEFQNTANGLTNGDVVSKRLKLDYLKQAGKLKLSIARQYKEADINNIRILKCKEQHKAMTCFCVSLDNTLLFTGNKTGNLVKWSFKDHKKISTLPYVKNVANDQAKVKSGHKKGIMSIAISFDNKYLAVGDGSNDIQVWNPIDLSHIGTLKSHRSMVTGLVFRQNSHTLYSCSKDCSVKVWSLNEMSYVETLYGHQDGITAIDALSRERAVTAGGKDNTIRIWKIAEESQLIYNGHCGSIDTVRLINEDNFISGGDDGALCIWSCLKKKPLHIIKDAHGINPNNFQPFWITAVASLLNTNLVASGSEDGFIKLWALEEHFRSATPLFSIPITGFINDLKFSLDGKYLIAAIGNEHKFGRWSVIKSAKNCIVVIPLIKSNI